MDLLLRQIWDCGGCFREHPVAIPVVVDLLLRPRIGRRPLQPHFCRNPCCSGPTASTSHRRNGRLPLRRVAIPVVVDLLLRRDKITVATRKKLQVAIPVVVDLLLRPDKAADLITLMFGSQSLL